MIQRIQTIYLFLAALIAGVYLYTPILVFEMGQNSQLLRAWELKYFYDGYLIFVIAIAAGISIGTSLIAVLLFKKPIIQKAFSWVSILGMLFCFFYALYKWYYVDYIEDALFYYGNITPWIVIVLNLLAIRGIGYDQKLVKSYERLR
jgi:hypothetical protein